MPPNGEGTFKRAAKSMSTASAPTQQNTIIGSDHPSSAIDVFSSSPASKRPKASSNYFAYVQRSHEPVAPGTKTVPAGTPTCLAGLTLVFTGDLSSISRDDATDVVKRCGGRVTTAPSGKTDYLVAGEGAGPAKMEKAREKGIKVIDEDGFLRLIEERVAEEEKGTAARLDKTAKPASLPAKAKKAASPVKGRQQQQLLAEKGTAAHPSDLWTVKYAPRTADELIGNTKAFETLVAWLTTWSPSAEFHAALLAGPPGIGKTTMAHLAARSIGMDVFELNASDTRSKKSLREEVKETLGNTSLHSFFEKNTDADDGEQGRGTLSRQVVIMDEVDGMSSGDQGGIAELIQLIKKTRVPIICVCNDRSHPKVRSLSGHCLDLHIKRPDARQIVPRIARIAEQEGLHFAPNALEELVTATRSDIRQVLNAMSSFRLTSAEMSYDESKTASHKKDLEVGPFDAVHKLLGSFGRMSMLERIECYFADSSLVPLMIHENYAKCKPSGKRFVPRSTEAPPKYIDYSWAAIDSISEATLVERAIRGANQEWSLSPFHAVMSSVRPASFVHGLIEGRIDFAGWFGQNSRAQKSARLLRSISHHSHLKNGTIPTAMRYDILPFLARFVLHNLQAGEAGISKTIELLDAYALTKEDCDSIFELALTDALGTEALRKIPASVKASFTRQYNKRAHLLPYATDGAMSSGPAKRISAVEFAGEEEEDAAVDDDQSSDEDGKDADRDKMVKMVPPAKAGPAKRKAITSRAK